MISYLVYLIYRFSNSTTITTIIPLIYNHNSHPTLLIYNRNYKFNFNHYHIKTISKISEIVDFADPYNNLNDHFHLFTITCNTNFDQKYIKNVSKSYQNHIKNILKIYQNILKIYQKYQK